VRPGGRHDVDREGGEAERPEDPRRSGSLARDREETDQEIQEPTNARKRYVRSAPQSARQEHFADFSAGDESRRCGKACAPGSARAEPGRPPSGRPR
jgi:hypothetical protein